MARLLVALSAALVVLAVSAVTANAEDADCESFDSCRQCVYDSSFGIMTPFQRCAWCSTTGTCNPASSEETTHCPAAYSTFEGLSDKCPDLRCSAEYTTNNVYFCSGNNIAALFFSLVLLIITGLYYMWMKTLWQLPWQFPNLHDQLEKVSGGFFLFSFYTGGSKLAGDEATLRSSNLVETRRGTTCPICKIAQPTNMGPSEVCYWCEIARIAFIPLYIGMSASILVLVFLFSVSMSPWFSNWYYAVLLVSGYVGYAAIIGYVYLTRVTILGDQDQHLTCFFQLAWVLRGRKIGDVFPIIHQQSNSSPPAVDAPNPFLGDAPESPRSQQHHAVDINMDATTVSEERAKLTKDQYRNERLTETIQMLSLDNTFDSDVRDVLKAELHKTEYIEWWDKPDHTKIAADDRWLIQIFMTGTCAGAWVFLCNMVNPDDFAITRLADPSTLIIVGGFIFFFFLIGLLMTFNGCRRVYILTNERIIIVSHGIVGVHSTSSQLSKIQYASVMGYSEWVSGSILSFSWEAPDGDRKMPPIRTDRLPAITNMREFLIKFRSLSPPLTKAQALKKSLKHLRSVWRLHIFINILAIQLAPIMTIYSLITPLMLSIMSLVLLLSFHGCLIQRGLRVQQMTVAPLNLAEDWTKSSISNEDAVHRFFRKLKEASRKATHTEGGNHRQENEIVPPNRSDVTVRSGGHADGGLFNDEAGSASPRNIA